MLEDPQQWATYTNIGKFTKQIGLSQENRPDIRVTQMMLKEKLLTGKSRERDKKLNVSNSPLLQKRSLRKFPMDYTKEESVKSAQAQRAFRQQFQKRVSQARTESENLRHYGRKMFENVVQNKEEPNDFFDSIRSARSTTPLNNGPTPDGSLLYNQRSRVLNSIRLRQQPQQTTTYNHERAKSIPPAIQRTLCQSNCEFRVITPHQFTDRSLSSASDYKLIPLNGTSNGTFSDYSSTVTLDLNVNSEHSDSVFLDDNIESSRTASQVSNDNTYRNRFVTPTEVRFYSLEGDTSSESSVDTKKAETPEPIPEEPKIEQPPPEPEQDKKKPKSAGRPKSSSRPKSGARVKSGGRTKSGKKKGSAKEPDPPPPPPQPEPVSVPVTPQPKIKKPLKGPRCWVDDATVSSLNDATDDQRLSDSELQIDEGRASRNSKTSQLQKTPVQTPVNSALRRQEQLPLPPKIVTQHPEETQHPVEENISKQKQVVINIDEIEDNNDFCLPKFLCPSSEKKSREAAVQDWLASTNFHSALASVPLF